MKKPSVVFVASQEYSNLGIGYMAGMLAKKGFETTLIDIRVKRNEIFGIIRDLKPLLIGFSVIYQYHLEKFKDIINYLRENGIKSHITAGGHYASLRYEELFRFIPCLDSVVRFEGEYTVTELAGCILKKKNWKTLRGLAFREGDKVMANPLRPPESDLDRFPYPMRTPLSNYAFNMKLATLLAGRGCIHNCAFCNQREFYLRSGGPAKRIRKPELVVREMEYLHREKDASVILIEDDDFPVKTLNGSEWVTKFCNELKKRGLQEKIMWKINCRPDEVEEKAFRLMKECGLFMVFLGIEDGTNTGLKRLNKQMTASRSIEGINTLKKLGIGFDYGFLLFQPDTTFRSLIENIGFLKLVCGDGYTPAKFFKLMPYYETRVEKELLQEGRIKGNPGFFDYDFIEEPMNRYYSFISESFNNWLRKPDGLVNKSRWARNYFAVDLFFFGLTPEVEILSIELSSIISESNLFLFNTMKELALIFDSGNIDLDQSNLLKSYNKKIQSRHRDFCSRINQVMTELLIFARDNQGADVYYHGR